MKRLIVMRHAKSSWADPGQRDHDRPLNDRGRRDAPRIGAWLAARGAVPDRALVSTARRTQETWAGLGAAFEKVPMTAVAGLYDASIARIGEVLRAAPPGECLLLLGHMPGIGDFARSLLADPPDDPALLAYPTAATAVIGFDAPGWSGVGPRSGRLLAFTTPKTLPDAG